MPRVLVHSRRGLADSRVLDKFYPRFGGGVFEDGVVDAIFFSKGEAVLFLAGCGCG